ncbi:very short patch repair endonuclease [Cupriavidus alkaliphilus]|uniref:very short patch repair endonuclease n=1 Tax=Cupriavidus alkaliphilus TaxID=942866 RepID=UPI00288B22DC|nr:very short patch repair endonuclease [Cupriavidus alkaliphilus]
MHSPAVRSRNMRAIRHKDTAPELQIRRALHARGFRFTLHNRKLPGTPDLVLPKYSAVVFVHGCFWHGHHCPMFRLPSTRTDFWKAKIDANVRRDVLANETLLKDGWRVATVWECSLKGRNRLMPEDVVDQLAAWLVEGHSWKLELRGRGSAADSEGLVTDTKVAGSGADYTAAS